MNEYNEGDLVEATKGKQSVRGYVRERSGAQNLEVSSGPLVWGYDLGSLETEGFILRTIEKAAPALPTEPGWYRSSGLGADKVDGLLHRSDRGDWTWVGNMFAVNPDPLTDKQARQHLPLVRLEPVADTATKVLAAIESEYGEDYYRNKDDSWNTVAKQFGVSK